MRSAITRARRVTRGRRDAHRLPAKLWLYSADESIECLLLCEKRFRRTRVAPPDLKGVDRRICQLASTRRNCGRLNGGCARSAQADEPQRCHYIFIGLPDCVLGRVADLLEMAINRTDELPIRLGTRITDPPHTGRFDLPSDILSRCLALAIRHVDTAPMPTAAPRRAARSGVATAATQRPSVGALSPVRGGLNGHGVVKCRVRATWKCSNTEAVRCALDASQECRRGVSVSL